MSGVTYDYQFKGQLAKNFVSQFGPLSEDKFFMCLSGITGSTTDQRTDENEGSVRRNMIVAKRIEASASTVLVPRYDWVEGISMDKISSDTDTSTLTNPFYVYDDSTKNVYICLENNGNETGSDIQPNGTSTDPIVLSDGFEWKFLYTIPSGLEDFIDKNYIPVKQLPFYERIANAYENTDQNQYEVQYEANLDGNAGSISGISITRGTGNLVFNSGLPRNSSNQVSIVLGDKMTVIVNQNVPEGSEEYGIRFLSGVASGVVRKIKGVNNNEIKLGTRLPDTQIPKPGDLFEIGPIINIDGDGRDAEAFGSLKNDKTIENIVVHSPGENYTTASTSFSVINQEFDYTLNPLIFDPIGKDPISELAANEAAIGVKFEGSLDLSSDEASGVGNDFINIAILKNPKITADLENGGKLLNFDDFRKTTVLVREVSATGSLVGFGLDDPSKVYTVIGNLSGVVGELDGPLSLDTGSEVSGEIVVKNMAKPFINDEILTVLAADKREGTFTQLEKKLKVYQTRFEDTQLSVSKTAFRGTLGLKATGINNAENRVKFDGRILNDQRRGEGKVVSVRNLPGDDEFEVFVTDLDVRGLTYGFGVGDTFTIDRVGGGGLIGTVTEVIDPQFDTKSGEMVYIQGLGESVSRVAEQSEFIKLIFNF
jgi:hypothetical protein|tara:strand:+ start:12777 stop:14738 length:1962 start_codon:yes stop_codon:yes gene_type:complete